MESREKARITDSELGLIIGKEAPSLVWIIYGEKLYSTRFTSTLIRRGHYRGHNRELLLRGLGLLPLQPGFSILFF